MVVEVTLTPGSEEMSTSSLLIITNTRHDNMTNSDRKVARVMRLSAICNKCRHYHGNSKCDAFPKKVPTEIMLGYVSHVHPYNGDQGLQYEPINPGEEKKAKKKRKD